MCAYASMSICMCAMAQGGNLLELLKYSPIRFKEVDEFGIFGDFVSCRSPVGGVGGDGVGGVSSGMGEG